MIIRIIKELAWVEDVAGKFNTWLQLKHSSSKVTPKALENEFFDQIMIE